MRSPCGDALFKVLKKNTGKYLTATIANRTSSYIFDSTNDNNMTASEIKSAVDNGKKVYWSNLSYEVIKDSIGQYLIRCTQNNHCIGLTWQDGETLNGKPEQFFIA